MVRTCRWTVLEREWKHWSFLATPSGESMRQDDHIITTVTQLNKMYHPATLVPSFWKLTQPTYLRKKWLKVMLLPKNDFLLTFIFISHSGTTLYCPPCTVAITTAAAASWEMNFQERTWVKVKLLSQKCFYLLTFHSVCRSGTTSSAVQ